MLHYNALLAGTPIVLESLLIILEAFSAGADGGCLQNLAPPFLSFPFPEAAQS